MSPLASVTRTSALVGLGLLSAGCTVASSDSPNEIATTAQLQASKVKLPSDDPCRAVLAPLALGLADGAVGLDFAHAVTVSRTSATDTRLYTVSIARDGFPIRYAVELDNDSASKCFFLSLSSHPRPELASDPRSRATSAELRSNVPVSVTPSDDDCASTVTLLSQAVALSAVGRGNVVTIDTRLTSETEDRDYGVHVDGKDFVGGGQAFANDYDFALNVSNDSAFKCWVQSIERK